MRGEIGKEIRRQAQQPVFEGNFSIANSWSPGFFETGSGLDMETFASLEHGDSGGPIFADDENTVVAIVAWTEGRAKAKCGSLTQGVLVAPVADWIGAAMRRLDAGIAAKSGG